MKIHDPNAAGITSSGLGQSQRLEEAASKRLAETGRGPGQVEDRVQLSRLAGSLNELRADSPERAAMIERLATEYREGRYRSDAVQTSRALINEALHQRES